ncbi:MAG TPA: VOC family protein [Pyrinomonadaceae bacterium]|jgi:catechol 2,3-dioxygenase-like lactoylglutathione lyase family enzyme
MSTVFKTVAPYADDAMNLPVEDLERAIPYYEKTFGFRVVSRQDSPHRSVILERDTIRIGLAENGGDPSQEGCFFGVENIEAAFEEINGVPPTESAFRIDKFNGVPYRVFFVVAPDGLCYMLGERQQ